MQIMKGSPKATALLILLDWMAATLSWGLFFFSRKLVIENQPFVANQAFTIGLLVVPLIWLLIYTVQGTYLDVLRLHRLRIVLLSLQATILGVVLLFFTLLIDDEVTVYADYYQSIFLLFIIHFSLSLLFRWILVQYWVHQIHQGTLGFSTLLIGGSAKAIQLMEELEQLPKGIGVKWLGFVNLNGVDRLPEKHIPYLGHADELEVILKKHQPQEVIVAIESSEHERLKSILALIDNGDTRIKIIPDMFDILSGSVKMTNIYGALLTEVNTDPMPGWQKIVKRLLDVVFSLVALILLIPFYLFLAIWVKTTSKGPIFYTQERVGLKGKVFRIIKFRTMYTDAEKLGPQLSRENDPRITSAGRIMRKMRWDEFPQFWNVLVGEMSLVGPRPERQFFIDQIKKIEPQFNHLTQVRPGLTSWGQVKFGYAENVEQMLRRMKFDLLYLRNRSLGLDFKILLYTVIIIFKGTGK